MKHVLSVLVMFVVIGVLVFHMGCGGASAPVKTAPEPAPVPEPVPAPEPSVESLRKPVAKDPAIFKAISVLEKFSKISKSAITYEKYQQLTGGQEGAAFNPDWFYENYTLNMNEDNYWATVILGNAKKSRQRDARIGKLIADLPDYSITIQLQTPGKQSYVLLDQNADGILDFAKPAAQVQSKVDIQLLDQMQEKYTWLLGLIKKQYK